jgi:PAS domain S-box-containing protein
MRRFFRGENHTALRIALIYAGISALWILFSDLLVSGVRDREVVAALSIAKGWVFVAVTAVLLYALVRRDVIRIYRTEAQMRVLFDSVVDGIYVFRILEDGLPGNLIDVNEASIHRFGYTREELLKMAPWDLVKPERRGDVDAAVERLRTEGQVVFETVHVSKDGKEIPVEISSRVVRLSEGDIGIAISRDITERKRIEEERRQADLAAERDKRRFYRETILAVTRGRFEIGDPEEASKWARNPEFAVRVTDSAKMWIARHEVVAYCRKAGLPEDSAQDLQLGVGEALGNAVKHAGGGLVEAGTRDGLVWVAVTDRGSGIDTFVLPKAALMMGFSTKASMGLGYTLILEVCDHVKLATGPKGTTVYMEKRLDRLPEPDIDTSMFPGIE